VREREERVRRYEETAREVHQVADYLFDIAVALEKNHPAAGGKSFNFNYIKQFSPTMPSWRTGPIFHGCGEICA